MAEPFGRILTAERRAQGFRDQAHLDAFYRHIDHVAVCPDCGQPGPAVPLDDGMQPTTTECPEGQRLFKEIP